MNRLRIGQSQLRRTRRSLRLSGSVLVSFCPRGSPGPGRQFAAASDSDSPSSRLTAIETPPASKIADGGGFRHPCCSGADYPSRQQPDRRSGHGESLAQLNSMLHRSDCLNRAISGNQLLDIVLRNVPVLKDHRLNLFEVRCRD